MSLPAWHEEPVTKFHDRTKFDCADPELNVFLKYHARQAHDNGAAKTYLAVETETQKILGYYTIAPASLKFDQTPSVIKRRLARHEVPVFRLARLAVDIAAQGRGLGRTLFYRAGKKCLLAASQVGGVALLIDAKHEQAARWYIQLGAVCSLDNPLVLLMPLKTIYSALLKKNEVSADHEST